MLIEGYLLYYKTLLLLAIIYNLSNIPQMKNLMMVLISFELARKSKGLVFK